MSDRFSPLFSLPGGGDNTLLRPERAILESLSEKDIECVSAIKSESLTKERHRILGVRSEDLFHFLACVKQGYLPVAVHELRGKSGSSHLYLSANPESEYFAQQDPDMFCKGATFQKMVRSNLVSYGRIAKLQAIFRNVIQKIPDRIAFEREVCEYGFHYYGQLYYSSAEEMGIEMAGEDFYNDLLTMLTKPTIDPYLSQVFETEEILFRALPQLKTSLKSSFQSLIHSLPQRSGICLAFSDEIARVYKEDATANDGEDLVYYIPDGRLPIKYVVGFESLGEYEDEVLAELGIE